jgi:hypothetical protein
MDNMLLLDRDGLWQAVDDVLEEPFLKNICFIGQ